MMPTNLKSQYSDLINLAKSTRQKAKRGLLFEKFLGDLFISQGISVSVPFAIAGEQIDGAFEYNGWNYLVEAKWQEKKQSTDSLYNFEGKVNRRIEGTRGLFISISGFTKNAIDRLDRGRKPNVICWSGEHINSILENRISITELIDISVRLAAENGIYLIDINNKLSTSYDSFPSIEFILNSCKQQIDTEIKVRVGSKFIPDIYVDRKFKENIDEVICTEKTIEKILGEVKDSFEFVSKHKKENIGEHTKNKEIEKINKIIKNFNPTEALTFLKDLKGNHQDSTIVKLPILKMERVFPLQLNGRLHVFRGKAGSGKTNLLCKLAIEYSTIHPTIFLTGRSGFSPEVGIKELIEYKLKKCNILNIPKERLFNELIRIIKKENNKLIIFIDAINEHSDINIINNALSEFLHYIDGQPIIVIASCREVYWPYFDTSCFPPAQWKLIECNLSDYTPIESEKAIKAYLSHYKISQDISDQVKERLIDPIILRFFCEAYGNYSAENIIELNQIQDIRLKTLFDEYLANKLKSLCINAPVRSRTTFEFERMLLSISSLMLESRSQDISRDIIKKELFLHDVESDTSLYTSILAEDIIIEEKPKKNSCGNVDIVISFTYDEFKEFLMAKSLIKKANQQITKNIAVSIIDNCQKQCSEFPTLINVLNYLCIIFKEDYDIPVWDVIDFNLSQNIQNIFSAFLKINPKFIGSSELDFLKNIISSRNTCLRHETLKCIRSIISNISYSNEHKLVAIKLVISLLSVEENILLKKLAIEIIYSANESITPEISCFKKWYSHCRDMAHRKTIICSDGDDGILFILHEELVNNYGFENIYFEKDASKISELAMTVQPDLLITDMIKGGNCNGESMASNIKIMIPNISILLFSSTVGSIYNNCMIPDVFNGGVVKSSNITDLLDYIYIALLGKYIQE